VPPDGGLHGHHAGHQRPAGLPDTHGPRDPQAPGPDARPGGNGAPVPRRSLRLAAGWPAGARHPGRPGRVGSQLTPDAPSLIADQFHPHVWQAASARWDTGQCRVAVGQATVSLSAHIAARSRRVRTYPGSGPRRRKQQVELGERPRAGGRPRAARADAHRGLPREDRTVTCSRYSADRGGRRSPVADPAVQAGPRHGGGKTPRMGRAVGPGAGCAGSPPPVYTTLWDVTGACRGCCRRGACARPSCRGRG
jgi:hypothetical protein